MHRKFSIFLRNKRDCKAVESLDIFEKLSWLKGCCFEGILWLFTNFYLHRKLSIFLRNDSDCKVVDPYNHLPQDWPHEGIQRIGWPANWSRFLTKWLKKDRVHNLDLLKKNSWTKILLKKAQTHKNSNFSKHPMLRFYEKHNLASRLLLFNKETQVEIFFESVFGKSKCDCRCLHFWHNCCFLK